MIDTKLSKDETVALWHAVGWMQTSVREMRKQALTIPFEAIEQEELRLTIAKRALRKVNRIRKNQRADTAPRGGRGNGR